MKIYWVAGIAMAAGLSMHAGECNVAVYVNSSFSLNGSIVRNAELRTAALFGEIGVDMRWRAGGAHAAAAHNSCGMPILVEIAGFASPQFPQNVLAYATPYAESGTRIYVFMDRIAANRKPQSATILLAYVLAHEITHILQGVDRHSEDGVMKARWNSRDYFRMQSKGLPFDPLDVELIHAALKKSAAAQGGIVDGT
jgi:hypothetical protein